MRWVLRVVLTLVVLVVLLVGGLFLLPADKVAQLASDRLEAATGRRVTLSGDLAPSIWPRIGVTTGPVTLSNAPWAGDTPMLQAKGLSVGLDAKALIKGDIVLRKMELLSPTIRLEKHSDGAVNWTFDAPSTPADAGEGAPTPDATADAADPDAPAPAPHTATKQARALSIDLASIRDGTVIYLDRATGQELRASQIDLDLRMPDPQGAADLTLGANVNGQDVALQAQVGQFAQLLQGAVVPVDTQLRAGDATLRLNGRAGGAQPGFEGTVDGDFSDLVAIFRAIGQPAPDLPAAIAKKIALSGGLTYAPAGSLHLRGGTIVLGDTALSGDADLTLNGKPLLKGQFTTPRLDLSAFSADSNGGGSGTGGGGGGKKAKSGKAARWSTDPIDVSALAALDAEVAIDAAAVDLGDVDLGRTRILATLSDRRLVMSLREVRAYDGLITGEVVVNGRGGLSVGGDVNVAGLAAQTFLAAFADYDRLIASGDFQLSFLGSGNSMNAIMNSLNGSGRFSLGQGELRGFDLAGMLRNLDTSYIGSGAKTIFERIGASFTIKDGQLSNKDLSFLAPLLNAGGGGLIGLGKQTLDYTVTPVAFGGRDAEDAFKIPLKITGTWSDPKFSIDLDELAKQKLNLKEQRKALEAKAQDEIDKAKAKARDKAAKELGLSEKSGEKVDLDKAARKKLEKKAEKELKKLFGGD